MRCENRDRRLEVIRRPIASFGDAELHPRGCFRAAPKRPHWFYLLMSGLRLELFLEDVELCFDVVWSAVIRKLDLRYRRVVFALAGIQAGPAPGARPTHPGIC